MGWRLWTSDLITFNFCHTSQQCFVVFSGQLCTYFMKFISIYFILKGIVNGIVFLISFSDYLLLVNRNLIDFSVLILYSLTLLYWFIGSRRFCGFLGLLRYLAWSPCCEISHSVPWAGSTYNHCVELPFLSSVRKLTGILS